MSYGLRGLRTFIEDLLSNLKKLPSWFDHQTQRVFQHFGHTMAANEGKVESYPGSGRISDEGDLAPPPGIDKKALMFKIDFRLLPALGVLYFLTFLDRVNIGNAAVYGLKEDLRLDGVKFNTTLTIFYVSYVVCQIPSNVILKKLKPRIWFSICMFAFGIITLSQGFVQSYGGLLATRFLLGVFEAGILPGAAYLIAMWYRREESQKRFTFFVNFAALGGAFGGLIASGIGKMDDLMGYRGWRWLFIIEGVGTCVFAVILYFLLVDFPEEASFLTEGEREYVQARLRSDVGYSARDERITFKDVLEVLKDYKIIIGATFYLGFFVPAYGYAYFAPTIIHSFNYSPIQTQLLSAPPWIAAFFSASITAVLSDYFKHRFLFTVFPFFLGLVGPLILMKVHDNRNVQYLALFFWLVGTYSGLPAFMCWFNTNLASHRRRAIGIAFQIAFGNIGSIIAAYSFVGTHFFRGYILVISFLLLCIVSTSAYFIACVVENERRDRGVGGKEDRGDGKALGDLWKGYRYMT